MWVPAVKKNNIELRAERQQLYKQYWAICNVCRRKPETPEETYAVRESRPLYHMRNGSDRESNPQPQWWQALMLISNIDLTTAPLWQPCCWIMRYFCVVIDFLIVKLECTDLFRQVSLSLWTLIPGFPGQTKNSYNPESRNTGTSASNTSVIPTQFNYTILWIQRLLIWLERNRSNT
jgi:hypothetical protein